MLVQPIEDARAFALLEKIAADPCNDAVIDRNAEALGKRFRKTDGAVLQIAMSDLSTDQKLDN